MAANGEKTVLPPHSIILARFIKKHLYLQECTNLVLSLPGLVYPSRAPSHTLLAIAFPIAVITMLSSTGQSSRSRERTRDKCVPRFLWMPEHSMHIKAPKFKLAQSGSAGQKNMKNDQKMTHIETSCQISLTDFFCLFVGKEQEKNMQHPSYLRRLKINDLRFLLPVKITIGSSTNSLR